MPFTLIGQRPGTQVYQGGRFFSYGSKLTDTDAKMLEDAGFKVEERNARQLRKIDPTEYANTQRFVPPPHSQFAGYEDEGTPPPGRIEFGDRLPGDSDDAK